MMIFITLEIYGFMAHSELFREARDLNLAAFVCDFDL